MDRGTVELAVAMLLIGSIALLGVWSFAGYLYWRRHRRFR